MNSEEQKKKSFPILTVISVSILTAVIVAFAMQKKDTKNEKAAVYKADKKETAIRKDEKKNMVIRSDMLSKDKVSFIRLAGNSRIELLALLGKDGKAKVALGTCQACNGSPKAYYTQEGNVLKCNNCGRTFPLSIMETPGGGCRPIMVDPSALSYSGQDAVIDIDALSRYEYLFAKVENH